MAKADLVNGRGYFLNFNNKQIKIIEQTNNPFYSVDHIELKMNI